MEVVERFQGKYRPFSNFWRVDIWPFWWPRTLPPFPGTEWAFHAWKINWDDMVRTPYEWLEKVEYIRRAETPAEAKFRGKKVPLRDDWNDIRIDVMRYLIQLKFRENDDLRQLLLDTRDADLIEGNSWGDRFWGAEWDTDFGWTGLNWLGTLLMEERRTLSGWYKD